MLAGAARVTIGTQSQAKEAGAAFCFESELNVFLFSLHLRCSNVCMYAVVRLRDRPTQTTTLSVCPFAITNGTHPAAERTRVGRTEKSAAFTLPSARFPGLRFATLKRL